jgi:hypothetical protein
MQAERHKKFLTPPIPVARRPAESNHYRRKNLCPILLKGHLSVGTDSEIVRTL